MGKEKLFPEQNIRWSVRNEMRLKYQSEKEIPCQKTLAKDIYERKD